MRILIAEDDAVSCRILKRKLGKWGYEVITASDGEEALHALLAGDAPALAILDWMMPGLDGVEVCRKLREQEAQQTGTSTPAYILFLTGRRNSQDIVEGLEAGANDYLTKPFNDSELRARVRVGERVVVLQSELAERIERLKEALSHIRTLQGILPICMYCHKIRTDQESWERLEKYLTEHTEAQFSHGLCPECRQKYYGRYSTPGEGGSSGGDRRREG